MSGKLTCFPLTLGDIQWLFPLRKVIVGRDSPTVYLVCLHFLDVSTCLLDLKRIDHGDFVKAFSSEILNDRILIDIGRFHHDAYLIHRDIAYRLADCVKIFETMPEVSRLHDFGGPHGCSVQSKESNLRLSLPDIDGQNIWFHKVSFPKRMDIVPVLTHKDQTCG